MEQKARKQVFTLFLSILHARVKKTARQMTLKQNDRPRNAAGRFETLTLNFVLRN